MKKMPLIGFLVAILISTLGIDNALGKWNPERGYYEDLDTFKLSVKVNGEAHDGTKPVPMTSTGAGAVKLEITLYTKHEFGPPGLLYHIVSAKPFQGPEGHMRLMPDGGRTFDGIAGDKWYGIRLMKGGEWSYNKDWTITVDFRPYDPDDPLVPMAKGVYEFYATVYAYQITDLNQSAIDNVPIKILIDDSPSQDAVNAPGETDTVLK